MTLLLSATATGALANPAGRADTKQKLASIIDGFSSFDSEMKIGTRVRNHTYDPVGRWWWVPADVLFVLFLVSNGGRRTSRG